MEPPWMSSKNLLPPNNNPFKSNTKTKKKIKTISSEITESSAQQLESTNKP